MDHVTRATHFSGMIGHPKGHPIVNLSTKFEVPNFTGYGNMKGVAKSRKWGDLGWLGVTQGH